MKITILAFNYGYAGKAVNGPGMCLANFVKFLKSVRPDIKVDIYTVLKSRDLWSNAYSISNSKDLLSSIKNSDVVQVWSGMNSAIKKAIVYANKLGKKVILGPNIIDTVEFKREVEFLKNLEYFKIFTVNDRLKFRISSLHNISTGKIESFLVGPDLELWSPISECDQTILWKGNGNQHVKDLPFAKEIEKALKGKYKFKFIGHPSPYNYFDHIYDAKMSKISIVTSLSETMGLAMMEGHASGRPSVSHPKIYFHGENYKTGIITNKSVENYTEAIDEIMQDDNLYSYLNTESRKYMLKHFSPNVIIRKYMEIVGETRD